ncbi:MAG: cupin [Gammaproteobacteria bacterium]|nr:cupin [Gammaproteobacteria bacterium]MDH3768919.1 cupin [Gammaproteobacteria bacterium]
MDDIILKRFETPDEIRVFEKGKFEIIRFAGMTIGRATYSPGWKWSVDVSPLAGTEFCEVGHLGMVLAGKATCAFKDGEVHTLESGDLFQIGPEPHDSWVVGDTEYVSLHFQGAGEYAK